MARRGDNLSIRGKPFVAPSSKPPMLDIVCNLWHPESNPEGYLSLGVAENTLMHGELIEYMTKTFTINSHSLTYGDGFSGSHKLRDIVAKFVNRHFKPVDLVMGRHVAITSGVGPAVEACAFSLCDPGDAVLLGRPYYGSFPSDLSARAQVQVVGVSFGDVDPFSIDTLTAYETALIDARKNHITVRALLLCNPHNPLGRCYTRQVLEAYMRFCEKHGLHLLSDEIYALSVWENKDAPDAPGFTSVLSIDTNGLIDPSLVHVVWGMSKDFCSNGIRLGCIISQSNDSFLQVLEAAHSYFSCPSAFSDIMASNILSDAAFVKSFTETNKVRLAANYELTAHFLERHGISYRKGSNAGFFIWVDLFSLLGLQIGTGKSDEELWIFQENLQATLLKHKVFLASGVAFGSDVPGWFRIVFAHEKSYLEEGLRRMVRSVEANRNELEDARGQVKRGSPMELALREKRTRGAKL